ncbi:hypothetical protein I7I48_01252 [Histoplasma ohiense]|nr:hypothetical protein I7I48_01252 [Histoplasma ohiense (nom. inval.)]
MRSPLQAQCPCFRFHALIYVGYLKSNKVEDAVVLSKSFVDFGLLACSLVGFFSALARTKRLPTPVPNCSTLED